MSNRFFVEFDLSSPESLGDDHEIVIDSGEAHHILHVMRLTVGDVVALFDGLGHEVQAEITEVHKNAVRVCYDRVENVSRELDFALQVAVCLPKAERQRTLIEKLTEVGVAEFYPLITDRSTVKPKPKVSAKYLRWIIESSKQCWRNTLMLPSPAVRFQGLLERAHVDENKLIFDPRGIPLEEASISRPHTIPSGRERVWIAIGPEGGFTPDELMSARCNHWHIISLGPRILRIETAAVVAATKVAHEWHRWPR